jgi:murein L,D-transpeptidase YafK
MAIGICAGIIFAAGACAQGPVDGVIVEKGQRRLHLISKRKIVRSYPVSLGADPQGHKAQEGDERTPEGRYTIDYRNPHSGYHLSLHISYPNAQDKRRARAMGVDPGGMIMIHGSPNGWGLRERQLRGRDWTNGCIAVANADMDEIWELVKVGTPIWIRP